VRALPAPVVAERTGRTPGAVYGRRRVLVLPDGRVLFPMRCCADNWR
jgi:hypothetical protein